MNFLFFKVIIRSDFQESAIVVTTVRELGGFPAGWWTGCGMLWYLSISTAPLIPTPSSLRFSFTPLLLPRWSRFVSLKILVHSLHTGLLFGVLLLLLGLLLVGICSKIRKFFLLLHQVLGSSFSYHSQGPGCFGRSPPQGQTQVYWGNGNVLLFSLN